MMENASLGGTPIGQETQLVPEDLGHWTTAPLGRYLTHMNAAENSLFTWPTKVYADLPDHSTNT